MMEKGQREVRSLQFVRFVPAQREELVSFLTKETWDFHVQAQPTGEQIEGWLQKGIYDGAGVETFWIQTERQENIGLVRVYDLLDSTALFDLRVSVEHRGQGVGRQAVAWLTAHVFEHWPQVSRIEGQTRQDNRAMRRVLRACGYVKEAHYRASWQTADGRVLDTVCYGMLKGDWQTGSTTPVHWEDEEE